MCCFQVKFSSILMPSSLTGYIYSLASSFLSNIWLSLNLFLRILCRNVFIMLAFLKTPFLVLTFPCYTLMIIICCIVKNLNCENISISILYMYVSIFWLVALTIHLTNSQEFYKNKSFFSLHIMSIYPIVHIQLSFVQLSILWYKSKTECMTI